MKLRDDKLGVLCSMMKILHVNAANEVELEAMRDEKNQKTLLLSVVSYV